mmetsp:Transcript_11806/g.10692  ORF Transcript_11806/g.10692 Transcript_11806/m.10692 type:complete len:308 (+) Transcript_11806:457-1380(+)
MEGKPKLNSETIFEITDYLSTLNHSTKTSNKHCYGIVFDCKVFIIFTKRGDTVVHAQECQWNTKGSKQVFCDFITKALVEGDNWTKCITVIIELLQVRIVSPGINESAFIGRGAFGRVVKVKISNGDIKALKISYGEGNLFREFETEFEIIKTLNSQKIGNVVNVMADSFTCCEVNNICYGGYLMEIGESLDKSYCLGIVNELYSELYSLHKLGKAHGDPRIANIIRVEGTLKWIDFRDLSYVGSKSAFRVDLKILTSSIYNSLIVEDNDIKDLLNKYFNENVDNELLINDLIAQCKCLLEKYNSIS